MTNIKTRGFASAELSEHLDEIDDERAERERDRTQSSIQENDVAAHLASLRREVADLKARLSRIREETIDAPPAARPENSPWMRIAVTVAATFVLGRIVQRLRLGAPGVAAVPLIATQLGNRF